MKQLICAFMIVAIMISFAACGTESIEGVWICDGKEDGYKFDVLGTTDDGEKMGMVKILPEEDSFLLATISYYYRFTDENKVEIIRYSPSFSGGSVSMDDDQYDVLSIEEKDGVRVLVSEMSGERYYYQGQN